MSAGQHDISSPVFHYSSSNRDPKVTHHTKKNVGLIRSEYIFVSVESSFSGDLTGGLLACHLGGLAAFGCGPSIEAI